MPYTVVKSFERGIDTRKLIDTTEPGTLLEARDCHITLGGELEKRAAFVVTITLPASTVGLWVTEGRVIHTWGDAPTATPPAGLPAGVVYHGVPDPDGSPLTHILSVEEFNSNLYVIAQYEDNDILHWWGGDLLVIPPLPPTPGGGTPPTSTPGTNPQTMMWFQLINTDSHADVTITGVYLVAPASTYTWGTDAFLMLPQSGTEGTWPVSDEVVTAPTQARDIALACMAAINDYIFTPGPGMPPVVLRCQLQATADASLTLWVEAPGPTYNGWKVLIHTSGPSLVQPSGVGVLSGGTTTPPTMFSAPTPAADTPGAPIEKGYFAIAHNYRMFALQNTKLNYSAPLDPSNWTNTDANAGFIDLSMVTSRKPTLVSMADYGGDLAIFGTRHIFVYIIDVVPSGDKKRQTIHGTGTFAPHSVVPWGVTDVMYLDISGIRSLRARDSSEQAFSADLGNLIDDLVRQQIATLTNAQKIYNVWGIVEPRSGRLWMALYDKIFVLNYYPSSRIAAWTWYDATDLPVDYMVSSDDSVYWRSGNDVVIYGNEDGDEYDDSEALARIPYIDAGKPATSKNWTGFDAAAAGTWTVYGSFDPTQPAALDLLATITKSTYAQQKIAVNGESPALSLELRSTFIGPARIGNAALHYTDSTAD